MFEKKKESLFEVKAQKQKSGNAFKDAAMETSAETFSTNGALKYSEHSDDFVTQFNNIGGYKKPRKFSEVARDCSILWAIDPEMCVKFIFFIRTVTRTVALLDGTKTESPQRGAGLKNEGMLRLMWVAVYHPAACYENLHLWVSIAGWKDIIAMMQYDLVYNGWDGRKLDWDKFSAFILAGLENPNTAELVKKYLPQIKAKSACKTVESQADCMVAKYICAKIFGQKGTKKGSDHGIYKLYRKLKSSGTAHVWQQLISERLFSRIDFGTVHGRALALMAGGKFLANQKLEAKYEDWIESVPVAKFTGYPHELFKKISGIKKYQESTINKQFGMLVDTAKKGARKDTSLIVVRDTSGSMQSVATGTDMTSFDIAKALALFFSEMLPNGHFSDSWIEFKDHAKMHKWQGSTPLEKWRNDRTTTIGSTNFLSVINLFAEIKQNCLLGIDESEFPTGILCISDGEFNPAMLGKTNVDNAKKILTTSGFSQEYVANFQIILWNIPNRYNQSLAKFETFHDVKNVFYLSGYDGAILSFLAGKESGTKEAKAPSTARELFDSAMDQEIMNMVKINLPFQ